MTGPEYKVIELSAETTGMDRFEMVLNALGKEGWDLISVVPAQVPQARGESLQRPAFRDAHLAYLKREGKAVKTNSRRSTVADGKERRWV
jgi:hypothetical protein